MNNTALVEQLVEALEDQHFWSIKHGDEDYEVSERFARTESALTTAKEALHGGGVETTGIAHSLAGFRGAFESEHGRRPTEQEIWNHAIRSWRDLNKPISNMPAPSYLHRHEDACGDEVGPPTPFWDENAVRALLSASPTTPAQPVNQVLLEALYDTIIQRDEGGGKRSRRELARRLESLAKQENQIADLILQDGLRVSSPIESKTGFGSDTEHRFEVSDGEQRVGVVIVLTQLSSHRNSKRD